MRTLFFALPCLVLSACYAQPDIQDSDVLIRADKLDFGSQWSQASFPWEIEVANTSGVPLEFRCLSTSCSCTVPDPEVLKIAPGASKTLNIAIDLRKALSDAQSSSRFRVVLTAETATQKRIRKESWSLSGQVFRLPLKSDPREIVITEPELSGLLSLGLSSSAPLKDVSVELPQGLVLESLDATGEFGWVVRFHAGADRPIAGAVISVDAQLANSKDSQMPSSAMRLIVPVRVSAEPEGPNAVPGVLQFGLKRDGFPKTELLEIRSEDAVSIDAEVSDSGWMAVSRVETSSNRKVYAVTLKEVAPVSSASQVVFGVKLPDGKTVDVIVPVRYEVVSD